MPRPVQWNPYAVRPVMAGSGVGAKESGTHPGSFAELLAEAERVIDGVRLSQPQASNPVEGKAAATEALAGERIAQAAARLAGTVAGIWQGLSLGPWAEPKDRRRAVAPLGEPVPTDD